MKTQLDPWISELRLVRTIDVKCLGEFSVNFSPDKPETAVPILAKRLIEALAPHVQFHSPMELYDFPTGAEFTFYMLRLEQLLATRCTVMEGTDGFLSSERDIIDGNIQLCIASPNSIPARGLFGADTPRDEASSP